MAYSLDFRKRVFSLKEERELTFKETSKLFGIDIWTLFRWQQRLEPKIAREKPATKIDMQALQADLEKNPDRFQYERAEDYGVSQAAIFYALKRLKLSRKKNATPPKGQWIRPSSLSRTTIWISANRLSYPLRRWKWVCPGCSEDSWLCPQRSALLRCTWLARQRQSQCHWGDSWFWV